MFDCVVVGDLHFRLDTVRWLRRLKDFLCEPDLTCQARTLVLLGDVLDSTSVITFDLLNEVTLFFEDLTRSYDRILIVQGNHDIDKLTHESHLGFLTLSEKIEVIEKPKIEGAFAFLPYSFNLDLSKQGMQKFRESGVEICFTHQDLVGFRQNPFHVSEFGLDLSSFESDGMLFIAGHFHLPQKSSSGRVLVLGSAIQVRSDEVDQDKFFAVIRDSKLTIQTLPDEVFRRFVRFDPAVEGSGEVSGKYVVVDEAQLKSMSEAEVSKKLGKSLGVCVSRKRLKQDLEEAPVDTEHRISKGIKSLFEEFCQQNDPFTASIGLSMLEEVR